MRSAGEAGLVLTPSMAMACRIERVKHSTESTKSADQNVLSARDAVLDLTTRFYPNRAPLNGFGSTEGFSPVIISASTRPLIGPSVRPR